MGWSRYALVTGPRGGGRCAWRSKAAYESDTGIATRRDEVLDEAEWKRFDSAGGCLEHEQQADYEEATGVSRMGRA